MRKIVIFSTALTLSIGLLQLSDTTVSATSTAQYVKVSGMDLNVRQAASITSKKLGVLKNKTKVTVISTKNNWAKIKFKEKYGYVSTAYLTTKNPLALTTYYVNAGAKTPLNIRKSASTSSPLLGKLKYGEKLQVYNVGKSWTKIKYKSSTAYVSSKYIVKTNPVKVLKPSEVLPTKTYYVDAGKTPLNVRKSESTSSELLGTIKYAEKVQVITYGKTWSKIKYKSSTAYVYSMYLKKEDPKKSTKPAVVPVTTYYVNAGAKIPLNVRTSATTASKLLGTIPDQGKVEVVSYKKDWSKIKFNKGYGYVFSAYIYKKTLKPSDTEVVLKGDYYAIPTLSTDLNIRKSASTSSPLLGKIAQNKKLDVIAQTATWTKIKFNKGYGYVSNDYVSKAKDVSFKRDTNLSYTVFDIDYGSLKTYFQKNEKNIVKWGNPAKGFTHSETITNDSYAFINYDNGYGYYLEGPIFKGATDGSLKEGYSRIASIDYKAKVKAGTFDNTVVQKHYNHLGKLTKTVYFAPKYGVIKVMTPKETLFELWSVK
ncbi:SH3 domain-containing protein [Kurthia sibirica]|uniref:SH3b domain-containing protein n=1 Tax=Kurthia sibirica TaxID=202750 RepID=A0A2U3AND5_9BACL|nr:SH3 domain-containing protein [Kurthia sibirica]PWI26031.1 hypothetical protein DEX24_05745 [Kurthia sibirica]GEK34568.1 hypothetical protein KSI01_21010 [Kurthia sibirica]